MKITEKEVRYVAGLANLELTDAEAARFQAEMSGILGHFDTLNEIDTAGVQLLMLAKQEALRQQRELRLVGHSPAVLEVFELLNVAAYFSDPLVMAARA